MRFKKNSRSKELKKLAKQDKKQQKAQSKEMERCAIEKYKAEALVKYYENRMNDIRRK